MSLKLEISSQINAEIQLVKSQNLIDLHVHNHLAREFLKFFNFSDYAIELSKFLMTFMDFYSKTSAKIKNCRKGFEKAMRDQLVYDSDQKEVSLQQINEFYERI